jgi:isopenicillin N synthase-like dioxygenase
LFKTDYKKYLTSREAIMKKWIGFTLLLSIGIISSTAAANDSAFDATIPVLDMNEYYDEKTQGKFVQELYDALKEVGFFAVVNTDVDPNVLDTAYQACADFFTLPAHEKLKAFNAAATGQRGYVPSESAKGAAYDDFKEYYHIGREMNSAYLRALNMWKNIWPDNFNLRTPLVRLFAALEEYARPLEEAIAQAIGVPYDFFTNMTEDGDTLLRAIHYPANPPLDRLWAAEHTDIDLLAILPRSTAEGLQVKNKQGEWIDVRVPEGAFVINGGDMLENITNGELRSGEHRVIAKSGGYERYSIVLFVHPRSFDRLDPLPACIERTGGLRKYANATRLELLQERLVDLGHASPAVMEELAESGLMERQIEIGRASIKAMKRLRDAHLASDAVLKELRRIEGNP